jgi:hypothetical protein
MAKLRCLCDRVLSSIMGPNGIEHTLISDELEPNQGESGWDYYMRACDVSRSVWCCPDCKRMAVFEPGANEARWYEPLETRGPSDPKLS